MDDGLRKGEVGDVRRLCSLVRIWGGKVVVWGGQRVLSLSRTRARMVGLPGFFSSLSFPSWLVGVVLVTVGAVRAW